MKELPKLNKIFGGKAHGVKMPDEEDLVTQVKNKNNLPTQNNDKFNILGTKNKNTNNMDNILKTKKGGMNMVLPTSKKDVSFDMFKNKNKSMNINNYFPKQKGVPMNTKVNNYLTPQKKTGNSDNKINMFLGVGKKQPKVQNFNDKINGFLGNAKQNINNKNPINNINMMLGKDIQSKNNMRGRDKLNSMLRPYTSNNPEHIMRSRIKNQRGLKMFGDIDRDGVANVLDCQPLNYFKQGPENSIADRYEVTPEEADAMVQSEQVNRDLTQDEAESLIMTEQPGEEQALEITPERVPDDYTWSEKNIVNVGTASDKLKGFIGSTATTVGDKLKSGAIAVADKGSQILDERRKRLDTNKKKKQKFNKIVEEAAKEYVRKGKDPKNAPQVVKDYLNRQRGIGTRVAERFNEAFIDPLTGRTDVSRPLARGVQKVDNTGRDLKDFIRLSKKSSMQDKYGNYVTNQGRQSSNMFSAGSGMGLVMMSGRPTGMGFVAAMQPKQFNKSFAVKTQESLANRNVQQNPYNYNTKVEKLIVNRKQNRVPLGPDMFKEPEQVEFEEQEIEQQVTPTQTVEQPQPIQQIQPQMPTFNTIPQQPYVPPQYNQYPTQQVGGGEIRTVEGVGYQKMPDGRWKNLKNGNIVTYPRGRYDKNKNTYSQQW